MKNEIILQGVNQQELIIREGVAPKPIEPKGIILSGNIDTPARWLEKKVADIVQIKAYIAVSRDARIICLTIDDKSPIGDSISGQLELHPDFKKWEINTGEQWTAHELAEFIKMNRTSFKDKATAMKLVTDLRKFTAKVNKELEAFKDDRANYSMKKAQVVETNLPESFSLIIPIFKGQKKETITVEISISPDSLACTLVSPEANDYIDEFKDKIIDLQIKEIRDLAPDIAIIEI